MPIQTRTITVTISDLSGPRLPGARVVIELKGLGNSAQGAVAPGRIEQVTDTEGIALFQLWQNSMEYSDTYYEISSWHPLTGKPIHQREFFLVGDTNADVKDLINIAANPVDATDALLARVLSARAGAEQASADALVFRNEAGSSATAAAESAEAAQSSNLSAAASSETAADSASVASGAALTATQQASESTAQANHAGSHARDAAESAGTASSAAETATSKASEAAASAESADEASAFAGGRATNAATSAATATGAADTATTKASEALNSAVNAASSESAANRHREDAEQARNSAIAAKEAAESAAAEAGKSAYDLAVENGFSGSLAEWLVSLRGVDGDNGDDGDPGLSAYEVAVNNGFTGSEAEWLATLKGEPGAGDVSSVDIAVPLGLSVSGGPITSSGTITITFAAGYGIPTLAKQEQWDAAHSWGNHAGRYRAIDWVPHWDDVDGKPSIALSGHSHALTDINIGGTPTSAKYLRGDGQWWTPPNTTYSAASEAEAAAGIETAVRVWSPLRIKQAIEALAPAGNSSAKPSSTSISYLLDGRINKVTNIIAGTSFVQTFNYSPDGSVSTVVTTGGGKTRTETLQYTNGQLTGMTATEVVS